MAATVLHIDEIVSDPKIRSGRPVIRGTGLRVEDVMFTHSTGDCLSPEQIAENYRISIGQVHAALAYYYLHKEEMDAAIRADKSVPNNWRRNWKRRDASRGYTLMKRETNRATR